MQIIILLLLLLLLLFIYNYYNYYYNYYYLLLLLLIIIYPLIVQTWVSICYVHSYAAFNGLCWLGCERNCSGSH